MKNASLIIIAFLISATSIAQQGINYKALIKDANGDVVANTSIRIHFTIQYDPQNFIVTYSEDHLVNTDANGLIVLNIGEGNQTSINDPFSEIPWAEEEYYLRVEVDISGGSNYIDLGTTQFMSVPYASHAETATTSLDNRWRRNGLNIHTIAKKQDLTN